MLTRRLIDHRSLGLAALIAAAACGKTKDDHAEAAKTTEPASATAEPAKAKQPITAAVLGKVVAPFGPLAKLTRGMPADTAEKTLDAANAQNDLDGVRWWMSTPENHKLADTLVELPTARRGVVAEAWGPGQDTERGGTAVTVWFNPETGTRAELSDESGHSTLWFRAYTPLAKVLGDGSQVAMLAKPFVGLSPADLAKAYPELADDKGHLWLPPTEWEYGSEGIPVSLYPMDGPIKSLTFSIPYKKGDAAAKASVLAAIEKKWGKVKAVNALDPNTKTYNQAGPHVEVSEASSSPDAFTVQLSEPKPGKKR
jgi:hypothetical protein